MKFSEPGFLVLLSLLEGPKHGYAMTEDIERLTGQRPGPGTLYGAVGRLEDRGLIEATQSHGRRKPYRLTEAGMSEARQLVERMSTLTREADRRLRLEQRWA